MTETKTNIKITMKSSLKWIILLCLAFIYLAIYPFIKKDTHKITEIYFAERMSAGHKILIEKFNRLNEGKIKVIPVDFPNMNFSTNERKELLARSLRGRGDGIDLIAVDVIWVQRFAKWCEPLDNYYTADEIKQFISPALNSCYYDSMLVAIPVELTEGLLYYREDLLKQLKNGDEIISQLDKGVTWDDFIKIHSKLNLKNPFYIYPADGYEGLICIFIELLLGQNKNYFAENGFNLNTPEASRALQLLVDLIHKYHLTPSVVTDFTEIPSYKYFIDNDAIFIRGWPTYDKDFLNTSLYSDKSKNLKKTHIPYFSKKEQAAIFGGWNLMMPKFTTKKKEVITFIKFLLSNESQEILYEQSSFLPVVKSLYNDSLYKSKYPELQRFKEMISYGVSRPVHEEYTRYSEIMSYYFKQAITNQISVKEALEKATRGIKNKQVVFAE